MVDVNQEQFLSEEIQDLLAEADAYSMARYPAEGRHPVDIDFLASPPVRFFVARRQQNPIGCVALVLDEDGTAELKRMVVLSAARGQGVGSALLRKAEDAAMKESIQIIRLETGPLNSEAITLYRGHGYRECEPFGTYEASLHSVFMEKRLSKS